MFSEAEEEEGAEEGVGGKILVYTRSHKPSLVMTFRVELPLALALVGEHTLACYAPRVEGNDRELALFRCACLRVCVCVCVFLQVSLFCGGGGGGARWGGGGWKVREETRRA